MQCAIPEISKSDLLHTILIPIYQCCDSAMTVCNMMALNEADPWAGPGTHTLFPYQPLFSVSPALAAGRWDANAHHKATLFARARLTQRPP